MANAEIASLENGTDRDSITNERGLADHSLTTHQFPASDDWGGWVDVWCREDTGNIDCVPECLRSTVEDLVTPEGWMKYPDMIPNTPYKCARWMHDSRLPSPPWIGTGMTPDQARRAWQDHLDKIEADRAAEIAARGDLYFIQSGTDGPIKIGMTGYRIERRMKALQTAHPFKLVLLALVRGAGIDEPEYHARFAEHRLEGEWFRPAPELLAEIERLATHHSHTEGAA